MLILYHQRKVLPGSPQQQLFPLLFVAVAQWQKGRLLTLKVWDRILPGSLFGYGQQRIPKQQVQISYFPRKIEALRYSWMLKSLIRTENMFQMNCFKSHNCNFGSLNGLREISSRQPFLVSLLQIQSGGDRSVGYLFIFRCDVVESEQELEKEDPKKILIGLCS